MLQALTPTSVLDGEPHHQELRRVVRDFAQRELAPHVDEWEAAHELPLDAVRAMAQLGLFGIVFPEEWGGAGGDFTSLCIAIEEIGTVSQSLGITLSAAVGLGANPIHSFGTDEQKAMWLPDLVAGRRLGAFGLTEPDAGSDAGGTRTRATFDAATDEWVLDGCRVPAANMLGARGSGLRNFLSILDDGRIAISALAVGCAQACLQMAVEYAQQRQAFGGSIGRFQGLAFPLADLAVAVENARNLTYKAAALRDRGLPTTQAAAMAKLYSTETAVEATRLATQVFGGSGFIEENPVARFYRDAKILEIGEGTSEIQRLVIARGLGLEART